MSEDLQHDKSPLDAENSEFEETENDQPKLRVEILGGPLEAVVEQVGPHVYTVEITPPAGTATLEFVNGRVVFANGMKSLVFEHGSTFSLTGIESGEDVLRITAGDESWEHSVFVQAEQEAPTAGSGNPLLLPGQPAGLLQITLDIPAEEIPEAGLRVIAKLKGEEVFRAEGLSIDPIPDPSGLPRIVVDLRGVSPGERHVSGDFVIEIDISDTLIARFEPPISNVIHEEEVIPELPASGGKPVPTSGMGEPTKWDYKSGLSTTTTVPVPKSDLDENDGNDPRDTPPPSIHGEELGFSAIPPFFGTCPDPLLFEEIETTTTEGSPTGGDPVYLHNGEFVYSEQDYFIDGRGPALRLVRTYRSRVRGETCFGFGRMDNFGSRVVDLNTSSGTRYVYKNGSGRSDGYNANGEPETIGIYSQIRANAAGGIDLKQGNGSKVTFSPVGQLARIADRTREGLAFEYNRRGQLVTVRDTIGRELTITYNTEGLIEKIEDAVGRQILYRYYQEREPGGSPHDLKSVTATATTLVDYPTGQTTIYTYEYDANNPGRIHNLVSITRSQAVFDLGIDPVQRFTDTDVARLRDRAEIFNVYDDLNRVVEQRYNTGIFYFEYNDNDEETIITDRAIETGSTFGLKTIVRYTGNVLREIEQTGSLGQAVFKLEHNDVGFAESTAYNLPSGRRLEFTYDRTNPDPKRRGDLIAMEWVGPGPDDRARITQELNPLGQVVKIVEPRGNAPGADPDRFTTEIVYDDQGNPIRTIFPPVSHYDSQGQVLRTSPRLTRYASYNEYGQVTRVVNIDGVSKTYTYYPAGDPREGLIRSIKVSAVDGSNSLETIYDLDQLGRPIQVIEANGSISSARYDVYGYVLETRDPIGARRLYEYDRQGRPTVVRLQNLQPDDQGNYRQGFPAWFTETRTYDDSGRIETVTRGSSDPDGDRFTTRYTHDEADRITTVTSNGGTVTRYEYGPRSLSTRTVLAADTTDEAAHLLKYNIDGQVSSVTDAGGNTVIHEYDWRGRLISLRDPKTPTASSTASTHLEYNISNNVTRVYRLDRDGNVIRDIQRIYNERGQVTVEKDVLAGTHAVRMYDDTGRPTRLTVHETASLRLLRELRKGYHHNKFGDVAWTEDGENNRIEYVYDDLSRLASVRKIGSNGQLVIITAYSYDAKNRVHRIIQSSSDDSLQMITRFAFDSRNLTVYVTDANGETVRNTYNELSQLVAVDRFLNPTNTQHETFSYDPEGRLAKMTDAGGNATVFEYNQRNDRTKTTVYDGSAAHVIHSTRYDSRGLPRFVTDGRENQIRNQFDEMGRLIRRDIKLAVGVAGPTFERFVYDDMNQLLEAENDFSIITQTFNAQGLVERETQTHRIDGQNIDRTIERKFNLAGAVDELHYPGGRVIQYVNDLLNRPTRIAEGAFTIATFSYLAPELHARKTYGNGTQATCVYDGLGRLQTVNHFGPGGIAHAAYTYAYDVIGNVLSETENVSQLQDLFTYDPVNQLKFAELAKNLRTGNAGRNIEYEYDWAGNLFSLTDSSQTTLFTANGLNQYITVGPKDQQQPYTWDKDFNLVESPGRRLYYDYARNLIRAEKDQKVYEFTYDAVRRLIHKRITEPGQPVRETHFYYDDNRMIETEGDEAISYVFGLGLDEVITYRREGSDYYLHQKRLWNVAHVTDDKGSMVESYRYDPYGARSVFDENGNEIAETAFGNVLGYNGRPIEQHLELYNHRARWKDFRLGRFISPDPNGWIDGMNVYVSALNNQTTFFDPMGTSTTEFLSGLKDGFKDRFLGGWWDTFTTIADIVINIGDYVETLRTMLRALTDPDVRATAWGAIKEAVQEELADAWNIVEGAVSALAGKITYRAGLRLGEALGWLAARLMRGGGSIAAFFAKIGSRVTNILRKIRNRDGRCPGTGSGCFLAGTIVITRDGTRNIEDVKVGDEVLSRNEETGKQQYKKVVRLFRGHTSRVVYLRVARVIPNGVEENHDRGFFDGKPYTISLGPKPITDEQTIRSTIGHPYWVKGIGWVHAVDLQVGDHLLESENAEFIVSEINIDTEEAYYYNFEVEDWHTYFVAEKTHSAGVWVHNTGCPPRDPVHADLLEQQGMKEIPPPTGRGMQNPKIAEAVERGNIAHAIRAERFREKGWLVDRRDTAVVDPVTGRTVYPDAITTGTDRPHPVENKPNTPSGRAAGAKQRVIQERAVGHVGRVVYYDPDDPDSW